MTADDAMHFLSGRLAVMARLDSYVLDEPEKAVVSLMLQQANGFGAWVRVHQLPPLSEKGQDIEQAVRAYAITQGWGAYDVFGHVNFVEDE